MSDFIGWKGTLLTIAKLLGATLLIGIAIALALLYLYLLTHFFAQTFGITFVILWTLGWWADIICKAATGATVSELLPEVGYFFAPLGILVVLYIGVLIIHNFNEAWDEYHNQNDDYYTRHW